MPGYLKQQTNSPLIFDLYVENVYFKRNVKVAVEKDVIVIIMLKVGWPTSQITCKYILKCTGQY